MESPIHSNARRALESTGFSASRIHLKFGYEEDVTRTILEEARNGHYDTVVVGGGGVSGMKKLFFGGITRLLQQALGCAVWVVGG